MGIRVSFLNIWSVRQAIVAAAGTTRWGVLAAVLLSGPAQAAGDHVRRLGAELVVLKADAVRLLDGDVADLHKRGLVERVRGSLAVLPLLMQASDDSFPEASAPPVEKVAEIRQSLADGNVAIALSGISALARRYRFDTVGLLPPDGRIAAIARVETIHDDHCAGCHDDPDLDVERPAWNLSNLARHLPVKEFAARLVVGVHGDALTALDNPLRDAEISALIAFYLSKEIE